MIRFKQYITELSQSAINKAKEKFKNNEDSDKYVELFNKLQTKHIIKGVDIFQLSFKELKDIVDKHNKETKTQAKRIVKQEGSEKVFENDKAIVMWIKSEKASCYYGANTHWCISGINDNMFSEYIDDYNIFFIISKHDVGEYKKPKFAMLIDDKGKIHSFWNEDDDQIKDQSEAWLERLDIPFNNKLFPKKFIKQTMKAKINSSILNDDGDRDMDVKTIVGKVFDFKRVSAGVWEMISNNEFKGDRFVRSQLEPV